MENQKESANEFFNHEENLKSLEVQKELPHNKELKSCKQKKKVVVLMTIFCLAAFSYFFIYLPNFTPKYTERKYVAEGLILASSAKNLVVDNAVNGFSLDQGWSSPLPTVGTKSISINGKTGVMTIEGGEKAGGIVVVLIPKDDYGELLSTGVMPQGRVNWQCRSLDLNGKSKQHIPAECRL